MISRHNDFADLIAPEVSEPATSASSPKIKVLIQPKAAHADGGTPNFVVDDVTDSALIQLRKVSANRPKSRKSLLSFLASHLGPGMTEIGAARVIERLSQAGNLAINPKGAVSYRLDQSDI